MITLEITGQDIDFLKAGVKLDDQLVNIRVSGDKALFMRGGAPLAYDRLVVTGVVDTNSLNVEAYNGSTNLNLQMLDLSLAPGEGFSFDIRRDLTKDEQVERIVAIAKSYGSKRVVMVWPPEAQWDKEGKITVDGSAIAAMVAASMSAYPAQQSFTKLSLPAPYKLKYSNDYFTPAQLKRMSEAGIFVLIQDAPGGQMYAQHQKSTSTASIQEAEFSITKAVDKLCRDLEAVCKPFVGPYNLNQDTLVYVQEALEQYLFNAKTVKYPKCGSLILDYSNLSLRANMEGQNTDLIPGTLAVTLTVEVGYPLNNIDVVVNVY